LSGVDAQDRVWVCDREGSSVHIFSGDGEILGYATKGFLQPSGIWGDKDYVYVGERGGGLSVFDMEMNLAAQVGFAFSSLRCHGLCGNSRSELFMFPLHSFPGYSIMKLTRV
jgi:sugar lactone lactonase YvrE